MAAAQSILGDAYSTPGGSYTSYSRATGSFSEPVPVLSESDRERFFIGKTLFETNLRSHSEDISPSYNATTCSACHRPSEANTQLEATGPLFGFSLIQTESVPFTRPTLFGLGRPFREFRKLTVAERTSAISSPNSDLIVLRAVPLVGMGLIDLIPDAELENNMTTQARRSDAIHGHAVEVAGASPNKIARFGWLPSDANLSDQVRSAARDENGRSARSLMSSDIKLIEAYTRFLAVPNRDRQEGGNVEATFAKLECSACHRPSYNLREIGTISPFSDFLAHDVGTGSGLIRRFRTPPLWTLGVYVKAREFSGLMHDGRAKNIRTAISSHKGEATASASMFNELPERDKAALVSWLSSFQIIRLVLILMTIFALDQTYICLIDLC